MQNQLENRAYAGFLVRLIAFAIDSLLAAIIVSTIKAPFNIATTAGVDWFTSNFLFHYSFIDVLDYVGVAAYFVLMTYYSHTTVGKMIMGLEVVSLEEDWTIINVIYRETIGRFIASLMNVGYLVVIGHSKKQGFHDMLCNTYVVYKKLEPRKVSVESLQSATEDSKTVQSTVTTAILDDEDIDDITMPTIDSVSDQAVVNEVKPNQPKAPVYYTMPEDYQTKSEE